MAVRKISVDRLLVKYGVDGSAAMIGCAKEN